jgi:hypothetical protein
MHVIALQFFDAGGLTVLLILSRSSMYPGFDVCYGVRDLPYLFI